MMFPLKDVRFITRTGKDGVAALHPRLIRDSRLTPQIAIAIRYFESLTGKERRALDTETLVQFFGDHKLARCLVACLGRTYRFETPRFEDVAPRRAVQRLRKVGLATPGTLRLHLYDRVNDPGAGFLPEAARTEGLTALAEDFRLKTDTFDQLLHLDAPEIAILRRYGAEPRPADVIAQYNVAVLATLVRQADAVTLDLAERETGAADRLLGICADLDVTAHLAYQAGGRLRLRLAGRSDAFGTLTRHGRRVARALIRVLEHARAATLDGAVDLTLRGREVRLRLTPDLLDLLGGSPADALGWPATLGWSEAEIVEAVERARSGRTGWCLRRLPDPQAWAAGIVVPDILLQAGGRRVLIVRVESPARGGRLAPVAATADTGDPLIFAGTPDAVAPLDAVGATVLAAPLGDRAGLATALRDYLGIPVNEA